MYTDVPSSNVPHGVQFEQWDKGRRRVINLLLNVPHGVQFEQELPAAVAAYDPMEHIHRTMYLRKKGAEEGDGRRGRKKETGGGDERRGREEGMEVEDGRRGVPPVWVSTHLRHTAQSTEHRAHNTQHTPHGTRHTG